MFSSDNTLVPHYQNSEGQSYEVTLKAGSRGYGRSGVTGSAGAYNVGARTQPQLIGCALAQEPGVLNFGLGLQTMEGDEYAETGVRATADGRAELAGDPKLNIFTE